MDIINNVLDFLGFDDDYELDPVEIYYSIVEKDGDLLVYIADKEFYDNNKLLGCEYFQDDDYGFRDYIESIFGSHADIIGDSYIFKVDKRYYPDKESVKNALDSFENLSAIEVPELQETTKRYFYYYLEKDDTTGEIKFYITDSDWFDTGDDSVKLGCFKDEETEDLLLKIIEDIIEPSDFVVSKESKFVFIAPSGLYSSVEDALSSLGKIPGSQWNEEIVNYV